MASNGNGDAQWKIWRLKREKILMYSGLALIGASFVVWAIFQAFRYEFLAAGLALCGISIAQARDRNGG